MALAAAAAIVPLPPQTIERVYAAGLFPVVQPILTSLSNLSAYAFFDALLAVGLGAWLLLAVGLLVLLVVRTRRQRDAPRLAVLDA